MAKASNSKVKPKAKSPAKPANVAKPVTKKPVVAAAKPPAKPAVKPDAKDAKKAPAPVLAKGTAKSSPGKPAAAPGKPAIQAKDGKAAMVAPAKPAPAAAKAAAPAPAAPAAAASDVAKKVPPKGITIVNPKAVKKPKPKVKLVMPVTEPLIKPGTKWKPLIQSGPKAPPSSGDPYAPQMLEARSDKPAQRMTKRELDHYKQLLVKKRAELLGDITTIEDEALRQNSGSLSNLPQHMADQGSDTFDQALSLDLAAVDRTILREIDEAMKRIDLGTFGICELTGQRISTERLEEIPWTRYTIEAAREMERRPRTSLSGAGAGDGGEKESSVD